MSRPQVDVDSPEMAAVADQVRRLAARYPDQGNFVWITFLIFGFLLIIPVVFFAIWVCVELKVNPLLGLVFGVAVWLGLFMFLRQCLFWLRQGRVAGFAGAFNAAFPDGPRRAMAVACLRGMRNEENEVLHLARAKLAGEADPARPALLRVGDAFRAGADLPSESDPAVDAEVGALLAGLQAKLTVLSWVHYLLGLGVPAAFFILTGIYAPKEEGLLGSTLVFLVIWNVILLIPMYFIRRPIVGGAARRFNARFPAGADARAVALAAMTRVTGCGRARTQLRAALPEGTEAEDESAEEEQEPGAAPATRRRRAARTAPPPAPTPPYPDPLAARAGTLAQDGVFTPAAAAVRPCSPLAPFAGAPGAIPLEPFAPPPAAPAAPEAQRFCTQCGKPLPAAAHFCGECGAREE